MSRIDPQKIEEYQKILQHNPRSPIFAALGEAYRQMGMLEEALEITSKGIEYNKNFTTGFVAHARVLYEMKSYQKAIPSLKRAIALHSENILASKLLALCYSKTENRIRALAAFKKLLILKPQDESAIGYIKKWEFLEHSTSFNSSFSLETDSPNTWYKQLPTPEHAIHLIDSLMNSEHITEAILIARYAATQWAQNEDLSRRLQVLEKHNQQEGPEIKRLQLKKQILTHWLQRIEQRAKVDPMGLP